MMARVRGKDTKPELYVRSTVHREGFRYRLHDARLPGKPDLAFPRYRIAVFVHGCFWHGHDCPRGWRPSSNVEFWDAKIDANVARDREKQAALKESDWTVVVIWECRLEEDTKALTERLTAERERQRASLSSKELAR